MRSRRLTLGIAAAAVAMTLAACSSSNDDPPASTAGPTPSSDTSEAGKVPASAVTSTQAFVSYLSSLGADDSGEPLTVDVTPPVDDAGEPSPLG